MRRLRAPGAAGSQPENPWYEVELNDARRDLLRRALFSLGHPVEKMKRVKLGPLELDDLADGHYRRLEPREIAQVRRFVDQPKGFTPTPPKKKRAVRRGRGHNSKKRNSAQ
jgi:16S rRNA U516 pseudouridylate synthase RsuA-like enzyme